MTVSEIASLASSIGALVALATTIWNILASGARQNKARIDAQESKINALDGRVAALEQSLRGMPGVADLHKIELALARMNGELGIMGQRLEPVAAIAERMQEILLQQSRK